MVINNELSRKSGKGKGTILIVDDIPENLRILNSILSENGYHVRPALNGQLALNSAQVDIPDMVLMDIKMPGMDGYETCAHLKDDERTKEVPVIFVSALQDVTDKVKCFKLGAVDYITKPFEIREILARVENQMTILNLQRELKARNKELEKTVKIREEVENIICHDLKGPLSPILSYPRMIRKKGPLTDKQSQYLRKIDLAGHKLLGIITLTNDLFKMEKGIYNFEPEPINLVTVIDTIVSEFSHIADQKDLSIQVLMNGQVIKEREQFTIYGHELLSYTMFYNLIKNAIEASVNGQKVTISLDLNDSLQISIHNEKPVPEDIRDSFFEKYTTSNKKNGTGLGTYSAKLAAETQGGTIEMKTSEKKGTTISISFPK